MKCSECGRSLIGERQKGHTYYRCHTKTCATTGFREETIETAITECLAPFTFTHQEIDDMRAMLQEEAAGRHEAAVAQARACSVRSEKIEVRLGRLLDAFLDGAIEKPEYEAKKRALLVEQRLAKEQSEDRIRQSADAGQKKLELLTSLLLSYKTGNADEKREMLRLTTSNLWVHAKYVGVELQSPYQEAADLLTIRDGARCGDRPRTRRAWMRKLVEILAEDDSGEDRNWDGVENSLNGNTHITF